MCMIDLILKALYKLKFVLNLRALQVLVKNLDRAYIRRH